MISLSKTKKQGRGRPHSKVANNGTNTAAAVRKKMEASNTAVAVGVSVANPNSPSLTSSMKGKRGRPKKIGASPVAAQLVSLSSEPLQKKRGRPKGSKNVGTLKLPPVKAQKAPLSLPQIQKKRGRPFKIDGASVKNGKSSTAVRPPKTEKPPKKQKKINSAKVSSFRAAAWALPVNSEPIHAMAIKQDDSLKKKRGRPPKNPFVWQPTSLTMASLQQPFASAQLPQSVSKESTTIGASPRQAGRPKKTAPAGTGIVSPGKRGRPKKSVTQQPFASSMSSFNSDSHFSQIFQSYPVTAALNITEETSFTQNHQATTDLNTKKRGRPKKILSAEEIAAKASPKKRGRPKKVTSLGVASLMESSGVFTESRETNQLEFPVAVSMSIITTPAQYASETQAEVMITEVVTESVGETLGSGIEVPPPEAETGQAETPSNVEPEQSLAEHGQPEEESLAAAEAKNPNSESVAASNDEEHVPATLAETKEPDAETVSAA